MSRENVHSGDSSLSASDRSSSIDSYITRSAVNIIDPNEYNAERIENELRSGNLSPDARTPDGGNALHLAVNLNDPRIVELLGNLFSPYVMDTKQETPLMSAIREDNMELVASLLTQYEDIDNPNNIHSRTVLHHAAKFKRLDIIDKLLEYKYPINMEDNKGKTPLMYAIETKNLATVKKLIQRGANINNRTEKHGTTAIYTAIKMGSLSITQLLLEQGADVNNIDKNGVSLLSWSTTVVNASHLYIPNLLIKYGAKSTFKYGIIESVVFHFINFLNMSPKIRDIDDNTFEIHYDRFKLAHRFASVFSSALALVNLVSCAINDPSKVFEGLMNFADKQFQVMAGLNRGRS